MPHIELDIPDLSVRVEDEINQTRVILRQPALIINQSEIPIYEFAENALFAITASYALNSGGDSPEEIAALISGTIITPLEVTSSFAGDGSNLYNVTNLFGGAQGYVSLWSTDTTLSSSILFQTGSSLLLGSTEHHTPEAPDTFGVYAGITDSYNAISVHGTIDNYFQINIKNFSSDATASSDIVATADVGTEETGYINMGINNSGYTGSFIGNALDAYLYATGSDLLIGNISEDKDLILFTGGTNKSTNARLAITAYGTVAINARDPVTGFNESLYVRALNDQTYHLITAEADTDSYSQINLKNKSTGSQASGDIVVTADNGGEKGYFVNFGINSSQYTGAYPGDYGGPNDAYFYTTGSKLYVGNATSDKDVVLFAGGTDFESNSKLRIKYDNQHELTGSLSVTGNVVIDGRLTAQEYYSEVISASVIYESGSTKFGDTADDTHQFTGSVFIDGPLNAPSITGSFQGDGSQLTGLVTDLRVSGSTGTDVISLLTDDLTIVGNNGIVTTVTDNTITVDVPTAITASLFGTASFATIADNITVIHAGIYETGSESAIIPTPSGGYFYTSNADYAISASYANYASFAASAIGDWNTLINKPLGIVSSSEQATEWSVLSASYAPIPAGTISSSAQLPAGVVSSSTQVLNYNTFATTGSNTFVGNQTITGSLTISGSATLKNIGPTIFSGSLNVTNGITGSINYNNIVGVPEGLVSSSGQVVSALPSGLFSSSAQLPSGIISSSTQLPSGIVSASSQVSYTELANLPNGIVSSSAQLPNGLISSSTQLPSGIISSSTQLPSGLVSSSTQLPQGLVSSSEQINTGSFSGSFVGTLSGTIESASYATTASYALVAVAQVPEGTVSSSTQVDYNQLQNIPTTISTASYVEYENVANKPTLVSASSQVSYAQLANVPLDIFSSSAQLPAGTVSSSTQVLNYNTFATTGSNTFTANQTITGSLTITSNLIVQGSSSVSYVSQSTLNIGTNMVTVNAQNPAVRFGGLAVIDSASSPQVSGSLLFDSVANQWLYVHQNQATITSSILLMGPETYNNVGNETHPTTNRVMKSINDEHLGDSQITDDGTTVSIPGNLSVSGIVSGSQFSGAFTGSLSGTATSASYASPSGLPSGLVSSSTQVVSLGTIRLTVGTTNKNSGAAFYFNSNTVTAGDSSSPGQDTAFLISSTGLSTVTVYLRQSAAGPNATIVGVAKNANGTAFSSATLVTSSSLSLTANTIQTYTFSELTLNQFDAIHIYVDPTSAPSEVFGVVIVS